MISVIIPTLNEAKNLPHLLADLKKCQSVSQIIVSDGGSSDNTKAVAQSHNVTFTSGVKGRGNQLNTGAERATNEILLFIHADSRIDCESIILIDSALKHSLAGSFYMTFDVKSALLNFYSKCSKVNNSLLTYGDQGLFISKNAFFEIGGYNNYPIMEDLDIVRRIKRKGRFVKINAPIQTSARRFIKNGILFQELKNILLITLFLFGASPNWLSKFYKS